MSDRPLQFQPNKPRRSIFSRLVTPRIIIYLLAVFGTMLFVRRYDTPTQPAAPANEQENTAVALILEPVNSAAALSQSTQQLPKLLLLDPGEATLPELASALREQLAGRCSVTRVDVSKDPAALAHFRLAAAPAALLYDADSHEMARKLAPLGTMEELQKWLLSQLQPLPGPTH